MFNSSEFLMLVFDLCVLWKGMLPFFFTVPASNRIAYAESEGWF